MTTLFIDKRDVEIDYESGALVLRSEKERLSTIPIEPIKRVIIHGNNAICSRALGKLGEHGIGVIVLSGRKHEPTLFMPRAHNDASRRIRQYQLSLDPSFCLRMSQEIVSAKLFSQMNTLTNLADCEQFKTVLWARDDLQRLYEQCALVDGLDRLRGIEGTAARRYFSALSAIVPKRLQFHGRNRRPPRDPFNAVLSLTYTIIHSEAVMTSYLHGLDPYIGFYHALDYSRNSLACDLMEPIRAQADLFALHLFKDELLRVENFSTTSGGCLLGKAGRSRYYPEYEEFAQGFRQTLNQICHFLLGMMNVQTPLGRIYG